MTQLSHYYGVSIVDFEQVNTSWVVVTASGIRTTRNLYEAIVTII